MSKLSAKVLIISIVVTIFVIGVRYIFLPIGEVGRPPHKGDGVSDVNTYSAVKYFNDHGLFSTYTRPMHGYKVENLSQKELGVYAHYPALPDFFLGVWAKIAGGTDNYLILRILPVFVSVLFLFFLSKLIFIFTNSRDSVAWGISFVLLSTYFIAYADSIHKHPWEELFKVLFILGLYKYYEEKKTNWFLLGLCVLSVFAANSSFEPIVFCAVVTLGFNWINSRTFKDFVTSKVCWALGISFVIGFSIHFLLNALYFGSIQAAALDLQGALAHRSGSGDAHGSSINYFKVPVYAIGRIERYFPIPGITMLVLCWIALKQLGYISLKKKQYLIALLVASFSWYIAMPQHAWVHSFVGKQGGIAYALVVAISIPYVLRSFQTWNKRQKIWTIILTIFSIGMFLTQIVKQMYWDYSLSVLFN